MRWDIYSMQLIAGSTHCAHCMNKISDNIRLPQLLLESPGACECNNMHQALSLLPSIKGPGHEANIHVEISQLLLCLLMMKAHNLITR